VNQGKLSGSAHGFPTPVDSPSILFPRNPEECAREPVWEGATSPSPERTLPQIVDITGKWVRPDGEVGSETRSDLPEHQSSNPYR
jgi:hypothetical protein